mmetsp:Transcript_31281/g.41574  ORF Transcript_31281/g.41574 Transcript_31281/m.41574 type:complete len:101 (+) Transcript_31281:1112-1414(+)
MRKMTKLVGQKEITPYVLLRIESLRNQGDTLSYSRGFAYMRPEDLDTIDESIPCMNVNIDNYLRVECVQSLNTMDYPIALIFLALKKLKSVIPNEAMTMF